MSIVLPGSSIRRTCNAIISMNTDNYFLMQDQYAVVLNLVLVKVRTSNEVVLPSVSPFSSWSSNLFIYLFIKAEMLHEALTS